GLRFRKIFMFYVFEYVPKPVAYIQRLVDMLDKGGELIIVTPSLTDPLKDLWRDAKFRVFFYDEHAINYFSPKSVRELLSRVKSGKTNVSTRQGYSSVNHVSWYLTGTPRPPDVVGADHFV